MKRSEYQSLTECDHEKHATYIVCIMCWGGGPGWVE